MLYFTASATVCRWGCVFAVREAYSCWKGHIKSSGRESTTGRPSCPSLPDIYLTPESNRWRLQPIWTWILHFYFTGCYVFPAEVSFCQSCCSELLLFPPSSLPLHLSPSSLHLYHLFRSEVLSLSYCLPLLLINFWEFVKQRTEETAAIREKKGQSLRQGALKSRALQQQINVLIKWGSLILMEDFIVFVGGPSPLGDISFLFCSAYLK